jgi:alpha-galactosidase
MLASPLIAGNDLRSMNSATQTILKNQNLIAINQDGLGLQAAQISNDGTRRVLAKRLANGDVAVALFNQGTATTTVSTTAAAVGKNGTSFTLREAWSGATTTSTGAISASVPGHGTVVYRVSGGTSTPPPSGTTLVSAASGRCLDVPNGATANGTQPVIWDCNGGANQRWTVAGQSLQALGKCLDAPLNATAGAKVQLWDCNGGTNQQWTFNADGTIRGTSSGLCLDVDRNLTANGTAVLLWTCTAAGNQRWSR